MLENACKRLNGNFFVIQMHFIRIYKTVHELKKNSPKKLSMNFRAKYLNLCKDMKIFIIRFF